MVTLMTRHLSTSLLLACQLSMRGRFDILSSLLHFLRPGEATKAVRPGPTDGNRQCSSLVVSTLMI